MYNSKHKHIMMLQEAQTRCFADLISSKTNSKTTLETIERLGVMLEKDTFNYSQGDPELVQDYEESFDIEEKSRIYPEEQFDP